MTGCNDPRYVELFKYIALDRTQRILAANRLQQCLQKHQNFQNVHNLCSIREWLQSTSQVQVVRPTTGVFPLLIAQIKAGMQKWQYGSLVAEDTTSSVVCEFISPPSSSTPILIAAWEFNIVYCDSSQTIEKCDDFAYIEIIDFAVLDSNRVDIDKLLTQAVSVESAITRSEISSSRKHFDVHGYVSAISPLSMLNDKPIYMLQLNAQNQSDAQVCTLILQYNCNHNTRTVQRMSMLCFMEQ